MQIVWIQRFFHLLSNTIFVLHFLFLFICMGFVTFHDNYYIFTKKFKWRLKGQSLLLHLLWQECNLFSGKAGKDLRCWFLTPKTFFQNVNILSQLLLHSQNHRFKIGGTKFYKVINEIIEKRREKSIPLAAMFDSWFYRIIHWFNNIKNFTPQSQLYQFVPQIIPNNMIKCQIVCLIASLDWKKAKLSHLIL